MKMDGWVNEREVIFWAMNNISLSFLSCNQGKVDDLRHKIPGGAVLVVTVPGVMYGKVIRLR